MLCGQFKVRALTGSQNTETKSNAYESGSDYDKSGEDGSYEENQAHNEPDKSNRFVFFCH